MIKRLKFLLLLACVITSLSSCSTDSVNNPLEPQLASDINSEEEFQNHRTLWGEWEIYIDPVSFEVSAVPVRTADVHLDITKLIMPPKCEDCLEFPWSYYNPDTKILNVSVGLTNQYPFDGYDVRGIVFTDNVGHTIVNADSWTPLYDIPGGKDVNPFKAFAPDEEKQLFASGATHSQYFYILMTSWSVPVRFAVDASWPGNCEEPYWIEIIDQEPVLPTLGAAGNFYVKVYDWEDDVSDVFLKSEDYFGDTNYYPFTYVQNSTWEADITNVSAKPLGEYEVEIVALSEDSGTQTLHNFYDLEVGIPANNPWHPAYHITLVDDLAYVVEGKNLDIYNVADKDTPYHIARASLPSGVNGEAMTQSRAVIEGGYAYLVDYNNSTLGCIDVDPPALAEWKTAIEAYEFTSFWSCTLGGNDFLYASCMGDGLMKIDISDAPEMEILEEEIFGQAIWGFVHFSVVKNGFAYMTASGATPYHGFYVGDLAVEEIVWHELYPDNMSANKVFEHNGYAYVAPSNGVSNYINVHSMQGGNSVHLNTIDLGEYMGIGYGMGFTDDLLVWAEGDLFVISISNPAGSYLDTIETEYHSYDVACKKYGNEWYAVVADGSEGLSFILLDY